MSSASLSSCRASSTSTGCPRRPRRHISPSSSLLSLLALVAADTCGANAAPAPLPLPFLYPSPSPSLQHDQVLASTSRNRTKKRRNRLSFPDKYVRGEDGRWRKTDTFTFNGYAQVESRGRTAVDAAASPSTVSPVALEPTPTCLNGSSFMECLPNGWKPKNHPDRLSLIVTISLTLAFFICFFIIGCLLWRKSMRRVRDLEQRKHRRRKKKAARQGEEEARSILEKDMKTKKKIWANATARWKVNAHYVAWRRRGKRTNIDFSSPQTLTPSISDSTIHSRPTSIQVSRTTTPEPSYPSSARHSLSEQDPPSPPSTPIPSTLPSTLPPAYQHRRSAPDYSPQQVTKARSTASSSPSTCITTATAEADVEIPYTSTIDAGHVATDDKAFLERLTHQASAPPVGGEESSTSTHQISVPVWRDEEISDFPNEGDEEMSRPSTTNHLFPPPPMPSSLEKGKMAMYYDYIHDGESMMMEESGPGGEVSAPPFEDGETEPIASAPPLAADEGDELEYMDDPEPGPSAAGEGPATSDSPSPPTHSAERRDSSLQQLGLDFEVVGTSGSSPDSLPHDLPVYRP